jgi:hypothetical protein
MSGASVSSTMASSGSVAASSRMRVAAREGHGAAETQLEAELDELVGLLPAAVEGVGDAAGHTATAQLPEHRIDGTPDMEQNRKLVVARQPQLRREEKVLPRLVARLDKVVEPDFADGQRMLAPDGFIECCQVFVAGAVDVHRMDAIGCPAARKLTAD